MRYWMRRQRFRRRFYNHGYNRKALDKRKKEEVSSSDKKSLGCLIWIGVIFAFAYPPIILLIPLVLIIYWAKRHEEKVYQEVVNKNAFKSVIRDICDLSYKKLPVEQDTLINLKNQLSVSEGKKYSLSILQRFLNKGAIDYVVSEFVRLQLGESIWPNKTVTISEVGLDGLQTFLTQKGAKVRREHLQKHVNQEFEKQRQDKFETSFKDLKPIVNVSKEVNHYVEAYVDIFGEAYQQYLNNLQQFIHREIKKNFTTQRLEQLIKDEIKKRTNNRMASAISSAIQRKEVLSNRITIDDIDQMEGLKFEHFLKELYTAMGYKVEVTKASGDQGADLIAEKFGNKVAIQAKRYSVPVGNKAIQEVIAAMGYYQCTRGVVVTNSAFTKSAIELAASSSIELVDRDELIDLIDKYGSNLVI